MNEAAVGAVAAPVILVDEEDRQLGYAEKQAAHERGLLHRAVSVFAYDAHGALLVQRRAAGKYHSGGLWSNSACTHPRPGETLDDAARRCVREELGMECRTLTHVTAFVYRTPVTSPGVLPQALAPAMEEHELDHVFLATVDGEPSPNIHEVESTRWLPAADVERELRASPNAFTPWFALAYSRLLSAGTSPLDAPSAAGASTRAV